MKKYFLHLILMFCFGSCSKKISSSEYAKNMLVDKIWFLDYSIQNHQTKSFIGKNTYFIQFSRSGKTSDSDGIEGIFEITENNTQLDLIINALTQNGSPANYQYKIDQIGSDHLMVSYLQEGNSIQKIFSTTH